MAVHVALHPWHWMAQNVIMMRHLVWVEGVTSILRQSNPLPQVLGYKTVVLVFLRNGHHPI